MLRIIAGKYRSRKIQDVKSDKTRPTTDKNKESLFNSLGQFFETGRALDLFSGSGSLGLEALSRGIEHVTFVERDPFAYKIIIGNIKTLKIPESKYRVQKADVFSFLRNDDNKYDLILADPPYALNKYQELLELVASGQLLTSNGIIVMESDKSKHLPEKVDSLVMTKQKTLGNSKFTFYELEATE